MFFYVSKIFWFVAQPLNLSILLMALAVLTLLLRWRRVSGTLLALAFLILAIPTWTSFGGLIIQPLEDRFARPAEPPPAIAGIIVLGGGFDGAINQARGTYELNAGGDRMVEAAVLAHRYPAARVIVSGGSGNFIFDGEADADTAPRLLAALGIAPGRLVLENRSRDTYENAQFSRELADPQPGDTWLLVTSAFHMPRSMALFRKAGFDVVPWPTDYRTSGREGVGFFTDNSTDALQKSTIALREWIGLVAYWLAGRIDSPFPG
ncbi:MAG: YdcF family protein [Rhizobiaceae bacterium]